MKKYRVGNYKLQMLLMELDDIEILEIKEKEFDDKKYKELLFQFKDHIAFFEIVNKFKSNKTEPIGDELFAKLKQKRKEKLNEYYNKVRNNHE